MKSKDMNWQTVPLGTLADFRNGINYTKKNFGKGIKVINVRNFQDYSYAAFDDLDEVNLVKVIKEEDLLKKNDIIFVRSNGNRQLIGRSLFVSDIKEKVVHSAFTIKVRFTSDKVIPRFYAYLFRTSLIRQTLSAHGNGTNISNLNQQILSNLPVPLPTLSTQNKIVNIISAYDRLIENNTRRIKILESMAQTIYQEWFVKFRFPGHEQVKMVESELGLIPEGWEVKELGDIASEVRRSIKPEMVDPKTPYLGLEHIPRKSIALSEWGLAEDIKSTKLIFKEREILFGKIIPYFHKVGVAPINGICSSDIIVIYPKCLDYFGLTLCCVSSEYFVSHATQTSQGTKMPRANWKVLIKYPIVLPPAHLLQEFNDFVENIVSQIQHLIFKNINLCKTRDLLLPKLISGQIDVENLEIDTGELAA